MSSPVNSNIWWVVVQVWAWLCLASCWLDDKLLDWLNEEVVSLAPLLTYWMYTAVMLHLYWVLCELKQSWYCIFNNYTIMTDLQPFQYQNLQFEIGMKIRPIQPVLLAKISGWLVSYDIISGIFPLPCYSQKPPIQSEHPCLLTSEKWGCPVPDTAVHHIRPVATHMTKNYITHFLSGGLGLQILMYEFF